MHLVVGLGNPGEAYRLTRHNLGFLVVDQVAEEHGIEVARRRAQSLWGRGAIAGHPVMLVKPQTFMNRSGEAVAALMDYFQLSPEDLVVVHDDLDLEFGRIRIVPGGGSGGHRGVHSIHEALATVGYVRVKVGISRPRFGESPERYVLDPWYEDQGVEVPEVVSTAAAAVIAIVAHGLDRAMATVNAKHTSPPLT
ncbi:MAG TPA: aminoacyl-tRNA hydrolase [Syntrophobacteria bacterium]|nr:aminoacyl-tRNA hydrolase [Syntrophobacteria bacterium]